MWDATCFFFGFFLFAMFRLMFAILNYRPYEWWEIKRKENLRNLNDGNSGIGTAYLGMWDDF